MGRVFFWWFTCFVRGPNDWPTVYQVEFVFGDLEKLFQSATIDPVSIRWQLSIGQAPKLSTIPVSDSRVFAQQEIGLTMSGFPTSSDNMATLQTFQPFIYNFQTMGQGYGYLLAAENFNFSVAFFNVAQLADHNINFKLFYRFVDIPLAEFVGIVQSTQQI